MVTHSKVRKSTASVAPLKRKRVSKRVGFPTKQQSLSKQRQAINAILSAKDTPRARRIADKPKHRERALMRATIRKAGVIPADASNDVANRWLIDHGWLQSKGNVPPKNRVNKLARSLGVRVPRNV